MQNYIINNKQITIEKNKEFSFKIPVLIKPANCEFHIDMPTNEPGENLTIAFNLKSLKSDTVFQIPIAVGRPFTKQNLLELNPDLKEECLVTSCTSNKGIHFMFSILRI